MSITVIFSDAGDVDCASIPNLWRGVPDVKVVHLSPNGGATIAEIRDAIMNERDTLIMCGHGMPDGLLGYTTRIVRTRKQTTRRAKASVAPGYHSMVADYARIMQGKGLACAIGEENNKPGEATLSPNASDAETSSPPEDEFVEKRHAVFGVVVTPDMASLIKAERVIAVWCYASTFAETNNLYGFWSSMFISNSGEARYCGIQGVSNEIINAETEKFWVDANRLLRNGVPLDQWIDELKAMGHMDCPTTKFNYDGLRFYPKH